MTQTDPCTDTGRQRDTTCRDKRIVAETDRDRQTWTLTVIDSDRQRQPNTRTDTEHHKQTVRVNYIN